MTLTPDVRGPKQAPHAFELKDAETGYLLVLACDRGVNEHRAFCSVLAPLCAGGARRRRN